MSQKQSFWPSFITKWLTFFTDRRLLWDVNVCILYWNICLYDFVSGCWWSREPRKVTWSLSVCSYWSHPHSPFQLVILCWNSCISFYTITIIHTRIQSCGSYMYTLCGVFLYLKHSVKAIKIDLFQKLWGSLEVARRLRVKERWLDRTQFGDQGGPKKEWFELFRAESCSWSKSETIDYSRKCDNLFIIMTIIVMASYFEIL